MFVLIIPRGFFTFLDALVYGMPPLEMLTQQICYYECLKKISRYDNFTALFTPSYGILNCVPKKTLDMIISVPDAIMRNILVMQILSFIYPQLRMQLYSAQKISVYASVSGIPYIHS